MPRPIPLKPRDRKPPDLGPIVKVERVRALPATAQARVEALINRSGLKDIDRDGLNEHDLVSSNSWQCAAAAGVTLEFDLPEAVPLNAVEIWNLNTDAPADRGVRAVDISVSPDGQTWTTVAKAAALTEAEGLSDYDQPNVVKLNGAIARKVRFENLQPLGQGEVVGLSEVVFHQAARAVGAPAAPGKGAEEAKAKVTPAGAAVPEPNSKGTRT